MRRMPAANVRRDGTGSPEPRERLRFNRNPEKASALVARDAASVMATRLPYPIELRPRGERWIVQERHDGGRRRLAHEGLLPC